MIQEMSATAGVAKANGCRNQCLLGSANNLFDSHGN